MTACSRPPFSPPSLLDLVLLKLPPTPHAEGASRREKKAPAAPCPPLRPSHPACTSHPPAASPCPGCTSSLNHACIWNVLGHEEFPVLPGEIPELGGRAQVMTTPSHSLTSEWEAGERRLNGIQETRCRVSETSKKKTKKKKEKTENKTKTAITPDGRGIGFWPPLCFSLLPPAFWRPELNAAGLVWLIGSVNQVSIRSALAGAPARV